MNTQTYTVNIRTGVVNIARVDVSQGDTGRTLAFSLYDGLIPFTPPTGSTVTIVGRKPSGLGFSETCTVSGNTAAVNTTLAMTQEAGKFPVELRIESDTRSIGTANFVMHVEPSPHPDGTTDGTHATVDNLQTQIGNLANLTTTAKTNLVSAINEAAQSGGTEVVIDNTLTQTGQAADAKKTGDEISAIKADLGDLSDLETTDKSSIVAAINEAAQSGGGSGGVSSTAINLLGELLRLAMYNVTDSEGIASKISALEAALAVGEGYSAVVYNLTNATSSNTSSSTQTGGTYTTTLTADTDFELTSVTVTMGGTDIASTAYSNGVVSISEVTGTIVITATASSATTGLLYNFNLKSSMTDTVEGVVATTTGTQSADGVTINSTNQYIDFGQIFDRNRSYVLQLGTHNLEYGGNSNHGRLLTIATSNKTNDYGSGLIYRYNNGWTIYNKYNGGWDTTFSGTYAGNTTEARSAFSGKRVTMYIDSSGYMYIYADGTLVGQSANPIGSSYTTSNTYVYVGSSASDHLETLTVESLKVFEGNYEAAA